MQVENTEFRPKIVAFCCNWCSYAGADLAGSSRLAYPADVKIIRVPCSCRVNPMFILRAFQKMCIRDRPLEEPEILWTVQLVRHRANRLSPAAEKFFRYLCSEFEEKKENGRSHVKCT